MNKAQRKHTGNRSVMLVSAGRLTDPEKHTQGRRTRVRNRQEPRQVRGHRAIFSGKSTEGTNRSCFSLWASLHPKLWGRESSWPSQVMCPLLAMGGWALHSNGQHHQDQRWGQESPHPMPPETLLFNNPQNLIQKMLNSVIAMVSMFCPSQDSC